MQKLKRLTLMVVSFLSFSSVLLHTFRVPASTVPAVNTTDSMPGGGDYDPDFD